MGNFFFTLIHDEKSLKLSVLAFPSDLLKLIFEYILETHLSLQEYVQENMKKEWSFAWLGNSFSYGSIHIHNNIEFKKNKG